MAAVEMTFEEWLEYGQSRDWVGPAVCAVHDGVPMTEAEDLEWDEEGEAPCHHILRLYEDVTVRQAVEENHSPSVWRQLGRATVSE